LPRAASSCAAGAERPLPPVADAEQVEGFAIVEEDWAPGGDELTPTAQLRREPIARRYARQIDALCAERRPADLLAAI